MSIKAIETEYKGHKFRSRLEARWAVFFNAMGWEWEYEPEGYKMEYRGEIIHYLPDFWLPGMHVHAEVKGPALNTEDRLKIEALAYTSDRAVYVFSGIPMNVEPGMFEICVCNPEADDTVVWVDYEPHPREIDNIKSALTEARQARFEHGEKG
tara:strand:- start:2472 stop:2930 length:459 start_codon:yes stop_codon:yes gene_type:complete